jgi:glycosyltransferase involved in cell wall biosynthesis
MIQKPPLISIITVTYNSATLLEGTINSVLQQTYPHTEYLIIDGASTDHTKEVIALGELVNQRLIHEKLYRWLSEPDNGLYDAMNKGLRMASGDYVLYLNAGDQLFEENTLEKLMKHVSGDTDVIYGETMLVNETRRHLGTRSELTTQKLPDSLHWRSLKYGMVVCHQAFIARRGIAPFFIQGNLAADIDWVISVLKKSRKTVNSGIIISEFLIGGLSKKKHRQSLLDRYKVLKAHYGFLPNIWNHLFILVRPLFKGSY